MEKTLVILKPDVIQRQLVGEIISRLEKIGVKIVAMKMMIPDAELLKKHYPDELFETVGNKTTSDWDKYGIKYSESKKEIGKQIVEATRDFMMSSPILVMVLEGDHVVEIIRKLVGSTGPKDAAPGTIRGDYAHMSLGKASLKRIGARNLIHASGTVEEANQEIALWFSDHEIFEYKTTHQALTYI